MTDITPRNQLTKAESQKLIKDIHSVGKKPTKGSIKNAVLFVKRLFLTLSALSITGLGGMAAYIGMHETHMLIKQIALIVSGVCALVDGLILLFRALMKTE